MEAIKLFIILLLCFCGYFLPTIIAWKRNHNNENPICLVNFFFGWTIVGWIIALIWSFTDNVEENYE